VTDWLLHVTQYTYDPAGNLLATQYPNKARIDYAYDAANRLTSVVNTTVGVPPLAFNYTLDPVGNRTVVKDGEVPTIYGYDALNQLTSAQTWFFKTTWTYDVVGNRLRQASPFGTTNYYYDAADRLVQAGHRSFSYDADGNEIAETDKFTHQGRTFTFDAANRLVAVNEGRRISFNYDGDGNRVSEPSGDGFHQFVNDVSAGLPVVLQAVNPDGIVNSYVYGLNLIEDFRPEESGEPDGAGAASQAEVHDGNLATDQPGDKGQDSRDFREHDRGDHDADSNYFYQYDGLGSVVQLTNSAGMPDVSYFYDAWGNSILPAPPTNSFRFTGQALDPATGLYYLRVRYYDPAIGRFLSTDPLANSATLARTNSYSYALSSPTAYVDPTGLASEKTNSQNWINPFLPSLGNSASTLPEIQGSACSGCVASAFGLFGNAIGLYGDLHEAFRGIPVSIVPGVGDAISASFDVTSGLASGDSLGQATLNAAENLVISKGVIAAGTIAAGTTGGAIALTAYDAAKLGAWIGSIPVIESGVSSGEYWLLSETFHGQQWATWPLLTAGSDIGKWLAQ
jgi:RHS repeat-associated protein